MSADQKTVSQGPTPDVSATLPRKTSAARLMRLSIWVFVVGGVAILLFASLGAFRVYSDHVIRDAEDLAARLSRAIVLSRSDDLLTEGPGRRLVLDVTADDTLRLDALLEHLIEPFDIVKIKVYDSEARIVYSTDAKIIGMVDEGNARLARALDGRIDSKLEKKEEVIDLQEETRFDRDVVETYVPIFNQQGEVIGSFEVYQDVTEPIRNLWRVLAHTILVFLAVIVLVFSVSFYVLTRATRQSEALLRQLMSQSSTDHLTGLSNRGAIYGRAVEECNRMKRLADRPLAGTLGVVLADVDRFKLVNDEYGREVGDEVLREVARRLGACVRSYDLAGRYGGEEFLMLLPETSLAAAAVVAERLRASVSRTSVATDKGEIPVTVSVGVAAAECGASDVDGALRLADEGLRQAKVNGRNVVVVLPPLSRVAGRPSVVDSPRKGGGEGAPHVR